MDPFIEKQPEWELFHAWFVRKLAEQATPVVRDMGCFIDVERTVYQEDPAGPMVLLGAPDALTGPGDDFDSAAELPAPGGTAVATAEPRVVHEIVLDPDDLHRFWQDYIVVKKKSGRYERVLTVVEVLSPANKSGSYAAKYREKRDRFLTSRAHFLEIDFLRDGANPSRDLFPELEPTPYFIFLARKTGTGRREEGYPVRLQDRLPVIGLPVLGGRPDIPLDLAAAFESAFDLSIHSNSIDYIHDPVPDPPLSDADAAWVRELIQPALH